MIIAVGVLLLWTLGCTFACLVAVYRREGSPTRCHKVQVDTTQRATPRSPRQTVID